MKSLLILTRKLKDRTEKLDRFLFTYLRVFEDNDTEKVVRRQRINQFFHSIAIGPMALAATLYFPYDLIHGAFGPINQVYMVPVYAFVFASFRELFGQISFRQELRYKEKMYVKYKEKVELTKDQVEEIEEAIKREMLKLEMRKTENKDVNNYSK